MTANVGLLLFLAAFWGLIASAMKVSNWRAGRRWSDGPSLFPMIPMFAFVAGVVGWLVNLAVAPWGSWGVALLHVGWLVVSLALLWLHPLRAQAPQNAPGTSTESLRS
jgi:hypothetical protein